MAIKHFTSNIENWYEAKIRKKMSLSKSMEKRKKRRNENDDEKRNEIEN